MRSLEIIAVVIGVFFATGFAVGILLVIALPMLRAVFWHRRNIRRHSRGGGNPWKLPSDGPN
jgi:hypothetical protein